MKRILVLLVIATIGLVVVGCASATGEVKASLGQEISLSIGQSVVIKGEDLIIKFEEVLEDSRCPRDVTCIWEGRVRCLVELKIGGITEKVELIQPGLTDQPGQIQYGDYQFSFSVEPYPEAGEEITPDEYRLRLNVSKLE
jgi:hypothetical protein